MENAQNVIDTAVVYLSTYGLKIVGAIVVLIVGRMAAGIIRRGVRRGLERAEVDATLVPFLGSGA